MFGSFGRRLGAVKRGKRKSHRRLQTFEHTHLGVYFVGAVTVLCIFVDSCQGVLEKYHNGTVGMLCCFAYWYVRPFIRRGIGSASNGYLNYYSVYIFWLCSSVFYHLPKLADMGMDFKADITVMISVFAVTILAIVLMLGLHRWAVGSQWIQPILISPSAQTTELWTAITINSISLAVACSTYFSFCGNAVVEEIDQLPSSTIKQIICYNWLKPVEADKYPTFKSWVLYGTSPHNASPLYLRSVGERRTSLGEDSRNETSFSVEARLNSSMLLGPSEVISPVLMVWITLLAMYLANCTADQLAVHTLHVSDIQQLRRIFQTQNHHLNRSISKDSGSISETAQNPEDDEESEEGPRFLPMVPWYSGTSADLIKMSFDLIVSLKLFLGRFDMRTMQSATSDLWSNGPHEGDGFTFLKFRKEKELWFDFFADTGDGGNSTYTIARALANPRFRVTNDQFLELEKKLILPRASLLLLGGDLAYPSPSSDTYSQRFFAPFQEAMQAPCDRPDRLIMKKSYTTPHGITLLWTNLIFCVGNEKSAPPQCFAIPGNHDWHDGLEIFMQCILHRGWLGGWELPQEKSYFAVGLPHDWWLFAADLALVWDIDMCQYRYFVQVIEKYLNPNSQVIIMTHEPIWIEDWITCNSNSTAPNLCELIRDQLQGRARLYLAGDLHFYMRHSLQKSSTSSEAVSLDPEHLVIQGMGGAFLHPTHVFCGAKINGQLSESKLPGNYTCQAVYPSPEKSLELGKDSLSRFRSMNMRFDLVGGLWYFMLVWSVFPRCSSVPSFLEASSYPEAFFAFLHCFWDTVIDILFESYVSLLALVVLFITTFLFAIKGSVGCARAPNSSWDEDKGLSQNKWCNGFSSQLLPAATRGYKARTGGYTMGALFAFFHTLAHLTVAIVLMLVLETGIYTCIKYKIVGSTGYHSLYYWFECFVAQHFSDPMGLREFFTQYSFGIFPSLLKHLMAIFDVPEAIAVGRIRICENSGSWDELTRIQTIGYYVGMLAYYWLLATPAIGLIFGFYLYISCCYFHVHYDETFSALRIQNHKGFTRMKIGSNGDLEIFSVAVDGVSEKWIEDPRWRGPSGGYSMKGKAHLAEYPSRWTPDPRNIPDKSKQQGHYEFKLIDHFVIPKRSKKDQK